MAFCLQGAAYEECKMSTRTKELTLLQEGGVLIANGEQGKNNREKTSQLTVHSAVANFWRFAKGFSASSANPEPVQTFIPFQTHPTCCLSAPYSCATASVRDREHKTGGKPFCKAAPAHTRDGKVLSGLRPQRWLTKLSFIVLGSSRIHIGTMEKEAVICSSYLWWATDLSEQDQLCQACLIMKPR